MSIQIRRWVLKDVPEINNMVSHLAITQHNRARSSANKLLRDLQDEENVLDAFVAENENGVLVGYVLLQPSVYCSFTNEREVYVTDLFVKEAYRRKGVGRNLMQAVCEWAKTKHEERGCGFKAVLLEFHTGNIGAAKFFESIKYQLLGSIRKPREKGMCKLVRISTFRLTSV